MTDLALNGRRRDPDQGSEALALYGLIAAAGFTFGWLVQLLG